MRAIARKQRTPAFTVLRCRRGMVSRFSNPSQAPNPDHHPSSPTPIGDFGGCAGGIAQMKQTTVTRSSCR